MFDRNRAQRAADALRFYEDEGNFAGMEDIFTHLLADMMHYSDLRFGEDKFDEMLRAAQQVYRVAEGKI